MAGMQYHKLGIFR